MRMRCGDSEMTGIFARMVSAEMRLSPFFNPNRGIGRGFTLALEILFFSLQFF